MKYTSQETQYTGKRSVAETLLETINETLGQGGLGPSLAGRPRGRRRRFSQLAAGIAMLAGVAALGVVFLRSGTQSLPAGGEPVAFLAVTRGPVEMLGASAQPASSRLLTQIGEPIHAGAVVDTGTGDSAGRTAIRLAGGQSMRLDTGSRVRFASSSSVTLERGAVYVDSAAGGAVEVRTTLGVVRDIGTQFEVRLTPESGGDPALRVRVREGSIMLEQDGASHHAAAGEQLQTSGGTVERGASPSHGPEWDWVLDTAPAPEIAGKPLADFLAWVSREGGWTVRFADQETARIAAATVLHGDVKNLGVTEASSMVLHGSGLDYRLEDGTFVVEPWSEDVAEQSTR